MLIGATGLVGRMTKFIEDGKHWISLITLVALFVTILYLARVSVPLPGIRDGRFAWLKVNILDSTHTS
uniref:Uncharacterized protein n=1 Tax=Ditylenchus dipsaci TaxID=166011 RepID=A0A915D012_9BILA